MRWFRLLNLWVVIVLACTSTRTAAQSTASHPSKKASGTAPSGIDAGAAVNGVYRNKSLGLSCKIPTGWVLRTEEMNAKDESSEDSAGKHPHLSQNQGEVGHPDNNSSAPSTQRGKEEGRVLLAAFSRPPEARGEDVNASIVIAAESMAAYPGMTDAAQYFGPVSEVAKAQGFTVDEEAYEFEIGTKKVVRADFHKDVGTRVMRQSTLAFLASGYAVSITVIGGTEDEVEELVDGIGYAAGPK